MADDDPRLQLLRWVGFLLGGLGLAMLTAFVIAALLLMGFRALAGALAYLDDEDLDEVEEEENVHA